MKAIIKAEYARLIQPFVSNDPARYYLCGFAIEPHPAGGAVIVATDGHVLGAFHDETGVCDGRMIVSLSKAAIAACKPARGDAGDRYLIVEGELGAGTATVKTGCVDEDGAMVYGPMIAAEEGAFIEGTFPDWIRVCPKDVPTEAAVATFDASIISKFQSVAASGVSGKKAPVTIYAGSDSDPAVVLVCREDFFGIVMPMRSNSARGEYPAWRDMTPKAAGKAA